MPRGIPTRIIGPTEKKNCANCHQPKPGWSYQKREREGRAPTQDSICGDCRRKQNRRPARQDAAWNERNETDTTVGEYEFRRSDGHSAVQFRPHQKQVALIKSDSRRVPFRGK